MRGPCLPLVLLVAAVLLPLLAYAEKAFVTREKLQAVNVDGRTDLIGPGGYKLGTSHTDNGRGVQAHHRGVATSHKDDNSVLVTNTDDSGSGNDSKHKQPGSFATPEQYADDVITAFMKAREGKQPAYAKTYQSDPPEARYGQNADYRKPRSQRKPHDQYQGSRRVREAPEQGHEPEYKSNEHQGKGSDPHDSTCKDKDNSCPIPQSADDVKQAYIAHGRFVWRELAAQLDVKYPAMGSKAAPRDSPQEGKARVHRIQGPILRQLSKQQAHLQLRTGPAPGKTQSAPAHTPRAVLQSATQHAAPSPAQANIQAVSQPPQPSEPATEPQPSQPSAPKPSIYNPDTKATKPASSASVSVASVDDLQHLWQTSKDQLGYGFYGVRPQYVPSDQALAVGPHPMDPDAVMLIQGVQGGFEVFMVTAADGMPVSTVTSTKLTMDAMMETTGLHLTNMFGLNPSAWYDPLEKRYVLMWGTGIKDTPESSSDMQAPEPSEAYPLFMAVSTSMNPLGEWIVWALDTKPSLAPGLSFCAGQPLSMYAANTPQATFSADGIFVSLGVYCGDINRDQGDYAFLSVLYAFSKSVLYSKPRKSHSPPAIYAATYLGPTSWYRSVPHSAQLLVEDEYKPFNSFIQPARPQDQDDVRQLPLFVMKVSNTLMSIATLTDEPLDEMYSRDTAPRVVATIVGKGGDFSNQPGQLEGIPAMPQPQTLKTLDAGDVGTMNRTSELRTYWAQHHRGRLYMTTSEYWGSGTIRMPSVYWGVVQPSAGLCRVRRVDWGVVASQDGLALAYPVIAARGESGAALAFAYSGAGAICDGDYPAYPGVGAAYVGESHGYGQAGAPNGVIQIVQRGPGKIDRPSLPDPQYWGTYSAAQVWAGKMWFAVVMPEVVSGDIDADVPDTKYGTWIGAIDILDWPS